jgi:hypothetical protein
MGLLLIRLLKHDNILKMIIIKDISFKKSGPKIKGKKCPVSIYNR